VFVTRPRPYVQPALAFSPCKLLPPASDGNGLMSVVELRVQFTPKLMLICAGAPSLYVAAEKSPERSADVGTVENASYGVLPRLPFHPAKKNHLLPPLKILGIFNGPPRKEPKCDWL